MKITSIIEGTVDNGPCSRWLSRRDRMTRSWNNFNHFFAFSIVNLYVAHDVTDVMRCYDETSIKEDLHTINHLFPIVFKIHFLRLPMLIALANLLLIQNNDFAEVNIMQLSDLMRRRIRKRSMNELHNSRISREEALFAVKETLRQFRFRM